MLLRSGWWISFAFLSMLSLQAGAQNPPPVPPPYGGGTPPQFPQHDMNQMNMNQGGMPPGMANMPPQMQMPPPPQYTPPPQMQMQPGFQQSSPGKPTMPGSSSPQPDKSAEKAREVMKKALADSAKEMKRDSQAPQPAVKKKKAVQRSRPR